MASAAPAKPEFMPEADRQKLREIFQDEPAENHYRRWDELWQQNLTPWDRNGPSLALRDTLTGHPDIFGSPLKGATGQRRKRAFVPGCGRGYDVQLLASLGYDTYGLDASPTAIRAAETLQQDSVNDERYAANDAQVGKGKSTIVYGDFFRGGFLAETGGADFDLIFDYTFLCALPPERRSLWAERQSKLLSPTGHLICLEWPLGKDPKEGGPPFGLTSELYVQLLRDPGKEVSYGDSGVVVEDSSGSDNGNGNGLVRVVHLEPSRTHAAGKGTDRVSVWKHSTATDRS